MSELIRDAERILRDCFFSFGQYPQATRIDEPRVAGVISGVPVPFFNGIAATNLEDDRDIDRITAMFRERQLPFRWWLTPSTRPHDLEAKLLERGFHHTYDANGMVADLAKVDFDAPPPRELSIQRVADAQQFDAWIDVFAETFDIPPDVCAIWRDAYTFLGFDDAWVHCVGYLERKPVTITSLLLAGDLGGIYCVGTIPEARGRGVGRALTLAAMKEAKERGAARAVLQSSDMGYGVYRAIGFEDVCTMRLYDWRPEYER